MFGKRYGKSPPFVHLLLYKRAPKAPLLYAAPHSISFGQWIVVVFLSSLSSSCSSSPRPLRRRRWRRMPLASPNPGPSYGRSSTARRTSTTRSWARCTTSSSLSRGSESLISHRRSMTAGLRCSVPTCAARIATRVWTRPRLTA